MWTPQVDGCVSLGKPLPVKLLTMKLIQGCLVMLFSASCQHD